MSSFQKVGFSLLTSVVLFALFVFLSQAKLLGIVETKFYAQSRIEEKQNSVDTVNQNLNTYIQNVLNAFENNPDAY